MPLDGGCRRQRWSWRRDMKSCCQTRGFVHKIYAYARKWRMKRSTRGACSYATLSRTSVNCCSSPKCALSCRRRICPRNPFVVSLSRLPSTCEVTHANSTNLHRRTTVVEAAAAAAKDVAVHRRLRRKLLALLAEQQLLPTTTASHHHRHRRAPAAQQRQR